MIMWTDFLSKSSPNIACTGITVLKAETSQEIGAFYFPGSAMVAEAAHLGCPTSFWHPGNVSGFPCGGCPSLAGTRRK